MNFISIYPVVGGNGFYLTETRIVEPVEPGDLARGDVTASLRHHADASLGIWRLEGVDVVNERWFRSYFKVPAKATE